MAIMGLRGESDDDALTASINTTPLVDIMLVLLIIFLITVPVVTHTVPVALPHEVNQPNVTKPREHHHRRRSRRQFLLERRQARRPLRCCSSA